MFTQRAYTLFACVSTRVFFPTLSLYLIHTLLCQRQMKDWSGSRSRKRAPLAPGSEDRERERGGREKRVRGCRPKSPFDQIFRALQKRLPLPLLPLMMCGQRGIHTDTGTHRDRDRGTHRGIRALTQAQERSGTKLPTVCFSSSLSLLSFQLRPSIFASRVSLRAILRSQGEAVKDEGCLSAWHLIRVKV